MNHKKLIAAVCAVCLCVVTGSGCSIELGSLFGEGSGGGMWGGLFSEGPAQQRSYHNTESFVPDDTMEKYDYSVKNTLNEVQTDLYNRLVLLLEDFTTSFEFENVTPEDFKKAYYAVLYDHPEFFWISRNYSYTTRESDGISELSVEPVLFSSDTDELRQAYRTVDGVAQNIADEAAAQGNIYNVVKYVHDRLIDTTEYDHDAVELISSGKDEGLLAAATPYGCLVSRRAVCSGYSSAFQLIMHKLGIACGIVNGRRATESGAHQWNYVCLDGEYYYIDLTWDDPIRDDGQAVRTYEYFLISEDDLARTHSSDGELPVPECSGRRYNYYIYNGLYFDYYDFGSVSAAADMFRADDSFSVKFSSPEVLETAVNDLIEGQRIFDIDYINNGIQYSVSVSGCILNVSY